MWPWPWGCGLDLGGCGLVNITALKYQLDSLWQCTAAPVRCVIGSFFLVFHELVFLVLPSLFSLQQLLYASLKPVIHLYYSRALFQVSFGFALFSSLWYFLAILPLLLHNHIIISYHRKKRFRWRNVKRLQGHLTNAKDSDKTRVRRKVRTEYLSDAIVGRAVESRKSSDEQFRLQLTSKGRQ